MAILCDMLRLCWPSPSSSRAGLVGGGVLVLRIGHGEEVLQLPLQGLEGGPLHRVLPPSKKAIRSSMRWIISMLWNYAFFMQGPDPDFQRDADPGEETSAN